MTRRGKTALGLAGIACLSAVLAGAGYSSGVLRPLDLIAYDWFFKIRGVRKGDERIAFVDIDEATVRRLGMFPSPRYRKACADLIAVLSRPGSRAHSIGFDIFFVETCSNPFSPGSGTGKAGPGVSVDEMLAAAARRHGRVCVPGIFPTPFRRRSTLDASLENDRKLAAHGASLLQGDGALCATYLADPWGQRKLLATRLGVDPERITRTVVRLLDEEYVSQTRSLALTAMSENEIAPFVTGRLDGRMEEVLGTKSRLEWTKEYFYAETTSKALWEKVYEPARKKTPGISFMGALATRGFGYDRLVNPRRFATAARRRDAILRARLAARRGVDAGNLGRDVLACYGGSVPELFPVIPVLEAAHEIVTVQPHLTDGDGKVRSFPLILVQGDRAYPAMGLQAALDLLGVPLENCTIEGGEFKGSGPGGSQVRVPVDGVGRVLLDWNGPWLSSFRHVSMVRLLPGAGGGLEGAQDARRVAQSLDGKIVFVGLTATGTHDLNPTPFQERYPMVGVNAHVAEGVLRGHFPAEASSAPVLALAVLGALLGAACGAVLSKLLGPLAALAGLGLAFFGSYAGFSAAGLFLPPVSIMAALSLSYVAGLFWRYLVADREGRRVRQIFASRTSPELVEEMMRNPEVVRLGGKRVAATIFFADLAGFTTVAEFTEPEDLIHLLNEYLSEISNAIIDGGGYLDKYEGDAVMAILGAPVERDDHAAAACIAAIEAQRRLDDLRLKSRDLPQFRCRVGLASGEVVVGNIGSETRADYTALGDKVNLASRLEGANKVYGTRILVSETTEKLAGEEFVFREVDLLRVKGRREATRVLELFGRRADLSEEQRAGLDAFGEALSLYRASEFAPAQERFMDANEMLGGSDGPSETFIGRCQRFMLKPPPEGWDGVYEMTGK